MPGFLSTFNCLVHPRYITAEKVVGFIKIDDIQTALDIPPLFYGQLIAHSAIGNGECTYASIGRKIGTGELVLGDPEMRDGRDVGLVLMKLTYTDDRCTIGVYQSDQLPPDAILSESTIVVESDTPKYIYHILWLATPSHTKLWLMINGQKYVLLYLGKGNVNLLKSSEIVWF